MWWWFSVVFGVVVMMVGLMCRTDAMWLRHFGHPWRALYAGALALYWLGAALTTYTLFCW